MEEYRKIWERAPKFSGEGFNFSREIFSKHYTTYKILNNTFRSVGGFFADAEEEEEEKEEEEVEVDDDGSTSQAKTKKPQNLRQLCAAYKRKIKWKDRSEYRYHFSMQPDPECPHTTTLDYIQQQVYWFLRHKLSSNSTRAIVTNEEKTLFSMLHQKVLEEQPVYCKYVESLWIAQKKRCLCLSQEVKKFVDTVWKNRISSVSTYPQKYCNAKMIPLVFGGDSKLVRALPAPTENMSLGIASRYIPPMTGKPLKINTDYNEMQSSFPPERFKTKVPVSRDKTAQEIACNCRPDVVISMSGLKCIMDNFNPDYEREWDIPIVVRDESPAMELKVSKRVIYIDKPLPPRSMSAVDKNNWYNKYGVRALFCRLRNEGLHRSIVPLSPEREQENTSPTPVSTSNMQRSADEDDENDKSSAESSDEDDPYPSDSSTERLIIACSDDEGNRKPMLQKRSKVKYQSKNCGGTENTSCGSPHETVSTVTIQKELKTYSRQVKTDMKTEENTTDSPTAGPGANENANTGLESTGEQSANKEFTSEENINKPCLMSNVNVTYRLWKLMLEKDSQEETRSNFLKGESSYKPLVLLVRNKQEAVRIENGAVCPVFLASKQEYQAEYGMSISTMSEVCRLWTSLYFRTNCTLVRARIDALTHEVLLTEEKQIEAVAQEWFDQRIRSTLLSILYSVLLGLQDVEPGNYLLSHRKKMGSFASLMKTTNRLSNIDLETLYESVNVEAPEVAKDIPWPPLDVGLQTPSQHRRRRVPGLFPIVYTGMNGRNKPPAFVAKKISPKKRKKKRKKKNK